MEFKDIKFVELIIVGCGPAGLSATYALQKLNYTDYLMIDQGKDLEKREKYDNEDAFLGAGGAGLYSDGKFSFYPCGTKVWDLPNKDQLEESYSYLESIYKDSINFTIPKFNKKKYETNDGNGCFTLKEYPSFYLSFEERVQLINSLTVKGKEQTKILMREKITSIEKLPTENYLVVIQGVESQIKKSFLCKYLILGGGKYFPLNFAQIYKHPQIFRRYEFGGRVFAQNQIFTSLFKQNYQENNLIDPKWVCASKLPQIEYKTFCMCVDGETILCQYNGIRAYSGRADCDPTGVTNFGLNVIIRDQNLIDFNKILVHDHREYEITLTDALDEKLVLCERIYGDIAGVLFRDGLKTLMKQFEIKTDGIKIVGPTIEGVGFYPQINPDLSMVDDENMFVVGDSTGIFRGIIPSQLSGIYVALNIASKSKK